MLLGLFHLKPWGAEQKFDPLPHSVSILGTPFSPANFLGHPPLNSNFPDALPNPPVPFFQPPPMILDGIAPTIGVGRSTRLEGRDTPCAAADRRQ